jgi:hypothetical protein
MEAENELQLHSYKTDLFFVKPVDTERKREEVEGFC